MCDGDLKKWKKKQWGFIESHNTENVYNLFRKLMMKGKSASCVILDAFTSFLSYTDLIHVLVEGRVLEEENKMYFS